MTEDYIVPAPARIPLDELIASCCSFAPGASFYLRQRDDAITLECVGRPDRYTLQTIEYVIAGDPLPADAIWHAWTVMRDRLDARAKRKAATNDTEILK